MKNKEVMIAFSLVLIVSISLFLASCDKEKEPGKTAEPTSNVETTSTPKPTEVDSTETPIPTPDVTLEPLSEEERGIPQDDAEVLFIDEFKNNESHEDVLFRNPNLELHYIENEQMKLSHDGTEHINDWDSYTPDYFLTVGETHNQYEFHVDLQTSYPDVSAVWMACYLGARVKVAEGDAGIPTDSTAGFFVAISKTKATIYPGTAEQWAAGKLSIDLPETAETMHKYIVVDDGTSLYYYMVLSSGDRHLLLKADISGDETIVTDKDGNEILKCANYIKENTEGYFKIFNGIGQSTIDNVIIKGNK